MKLLVDACAGRRLAKGLAAAGNEVDFVGDWLSDPGDEQILQKATEAGAIVITRDKDFGTLAVLHARKHCGILRLVEIPASHEMVQCTQALERYAVLLRNGALITVEAARIRIREPE